MRFDVLTLFPEMFAGPLDSSILGRGRAAGLIEIFIHNIRDFADDRHRTADDYPYGGGAGMVLKADPVFRAADALLPGWDEVRGAGGRYPGVRFVYLTPQGYTLDQRTAARLAAESRLVILSGHYEGVDHRIREALVDEEISIGDYVLTGGELPAMVLIDTISRLVPGVLGRETSAYEESFSESLLEYPHYTRPAETRGFIVPEVLLSGHHEMIRKWRRRESLRLTLDRRPELLLHARLTPEDHEFLQELAGVGEGNDHAARSTVDGFPPGPAEGRKEHRG